MQYNKILQFFSADDFKISYNYSIILEPQNVH